ncbi:MAG TPA: pilus assembly protein TadG-related protein [Stellaceae bacterium]|nr:pilus assembly protein TadG-related protein [Stellaceae bacterium]
MISMMSRASVWVGKTKDYWRWVAKPSAELVTPRGLLSSTLSIWSDEGGGVAVILGLVATLVIAIVGLGVDVVYWYRTDRAMQNAADSAAIAAASNGTSSYQNEAKAVASQYGFDDGSKGVTVTALNNQTCPGGGTNCFKVTVAMAAAPQFFSQVVGLPPPPLSSAAMAGGSQLHKYCMLALAGSGTDPAILTHGAPNADLTNCTIMSNTGSTCTGHNLNATYGDAHGTNNGCGISEHSNVPAVSDPYVGLAVNIPANPCKTSDYSWEPTKKKDPALDTSSLHTWGVANASSTITLTNSSTIAPTIGNGIVCGDLQLAQNATVTVNTASPGSILVIENGQLDTNGGTLQTASGSAVTVIFSGDPSDSHNHSPTNAGTLNLQAPTTGTWKGVAIYQDPNLKNGLDFTYSGNNPTWDITGLTYFPHASVTFSGAVNKSSNGASCFVLVADNITINGTANILETGGCAAAGLDMPTDTIAAAGLVL